MLYDKPQKNKWHELVREDVGMKTVVRKLESSCAY